MRATLKQRTDAVRIKKELHVELPSELTVDAYADWLSMYTPIYVKQKCENDIRSINALFVKRDFIH